MKRIVHALIPTLALCAAIACAPGKSIDTETAPRAEKPRGIASLILAPETLSEEGELAVARLIAEYGLKGDGGALEIARFTGTAPSPKAVRETIEKFTETPWMKAIVVMKAPRGTAEAFFRLKNRAPDVLKIAIDPEDDRFTVEAAADLVISEDPGIRGYTAAREANLLGTKRIVYLGRPQPTTENEAIRLAALTRAAKEFGMAVIETRPKALADLATDSRKVADALFKEWETLGASSMAVFCEVPGLIPRLTERNLPGMTLFPGASPSFLPFGGVSQTASGSPDWKKTLAEAEKTLAQDAPAITVSAWPWPADYVKLTGTYDFLRAVESGEASLTSIEGAKDWFGRRMPGGRFALDRAVDPDSGIRSKNHFTFREQEWIAGKGWSEASLETVPDWARRATTR